MDETELFYGNKGAPKMKRLKEGLQKIENKHSEYFEERNSPLSIEKHDRLHNHYDMNTNPNGVFFGIKPGSDLKEEIKIECQNLFNKIFKLEGKN
ncbi:hypothetical protein [Flavobacterium algoritolerans]|uniref:Uncharacterized protein n=1 Tax=Flavobacterium algoritolerans TaxID=3041254 RepID=A0ABT6V904_9FLAO|nr:hypothetical protein [Flavobacterium algoritolerans]MDI5894713.1 hypothetical protein [Flavobacterium algoritolerans]